MRNFEWHCELRLTLLAQAIVSIATLDQLPDGRDQQSTIEDGKTVEKGSWTRASIDLQAKRD
jgi:hypothetical protein